MSLAKWLTLYLIQNQIYYATLSKCKKKTQTKKQQQQKNKQT